MYLKSIHIQNFKSFENVTIHFNEDINIFTGANNTGKTTILEAIALWNECFEKLIAQISKADTKKKLLKGDFTLGTSQPKYVPHTDIVSVRSPSYEDIFYNLKTTQPISISAAVHNKLANQSIHIGFTISAARGNQYLISTDDFERFDFRAFNTFFTKLPEAISLTFASPVANLKDNEDFETVPKIKRLTNSRASVIVLRNRIYQLKKNAPRFNDFVKNLQYILNNSQTNLFFTVIGDETKDTQLKINLQIGSRDEPKNISLLGSGTLQIIEILLSLYENKKDINLILLDEPDSHIHRDMQKRLLVTLSTFTQDTQIFLTTHNEALIRSAMPIHLFHIEAKSHNEYRNISADLPSGVKKGLQPTPYFNIIHSINGGNGLDFINALESDKIILTEGEDDARYIGILLKAHIQNNRKYVYWAFDGISGIFKHVLAYKDIFSAIKNQTSLWQKSVLIFDKDFLSNEQRLAFHQKLAHKLNIPIYISQSYTFEASILSETPKFINSVHRYLIGKGKNPSLNEVGRLAEVAILKVIEQKTSDFNNDAKVDEWTFHLKGLRKKIANPPLEIDKIWESDDTKLRSALKNYAQSTFSISNIHQLAKKEDVEAIIHSICQDYELSFSMDTDFCDFLQLIVDERSNWFSEWDKIINL
jgi:AAA15 family ATPase/GTPase